MKQAIIAIMLALKKDLFYLTLSFPLRYKGVFF